VQKTVTGQKLFLFFFVESFGLCIAWGTGASMAWIYAFWSFTGHENAQYWQNAPALMTALEREKKKATGEPVLLMGGGRRKADLRVHIGDDAINLMTIHT
jgi:hypothetical protein